MPHYKCVACKVRAHHTGKLGDPAGDRCPVCGAALEPVGRLVEVVGYTSMKPSRSATPALGTAPQATAVHQIRTKR